MLSVTELHKLTQYSDGLESPFQTQLVLDNVYNLLVTQPTIGISEMSR